MCKFMVNSGCLDIIKEILKQCENDHDNNNTKECDYKYKYKIKNKNVNKILRSFNPIINNLKSYELLIDFDYDKMRENARDFLKELQEYVFEPNRLERISIAYNIEFIELLRIY